MSFRHGSRWYSGSCMQLHEYCLNSQLINWSFLLFCWKNNRCLSRANRSKKPQETGNNSNRIWHIHIDERRTFEYFLRILFSVRGVRMFGVDFFFSQLKIAPLIKSDLREKKLKFKFQSIYRSTNKVDVMDGTFSMPLRFYDVFSVFFFFFFCDINISLTAVSSITRNAQRCADKKSRLFLENIYAMHLHRMLSVDRPLDIHNSITNSVCCW